MMSSTCLEAATGGGGEAAAAAAAAEAGVARPVPCGAFAGSLPLPPRLLMLLLLPLPSAAPLAAERPSAAAVCGLRVSSFSRSTAPGEVETQPSFWFCPGRE